MTPRERVLRALERKTPDCVPKWMDFNEAVRRRVPDPAKHFDVDLRVVSFEATRRDTRFAEYLAQVPRDAEVGGQAILRSYSEWRYLPGTASEHPLAALPDLEELERDALPDIAADYRSARLKEKVAEHHRQGFAVVGHQPHLGGIIFEAGYRLIGFERFLVELAEGAAFARLLMDWLTEQCARNSATLAAADVDILYLGDDVGGPTGLLISPQLWRREIRPRLARTIAAARSANARIHVAYHSDGDITALIPDLVEIGVDVLHPVQPDWMDPVALKARYGDRLSFWGTVGSHRLLSFGKPRQVKDEVKRRIEIMGEGGGFIASPAYDNHSDVPWQNVVAFFQAVARYGRY